MKQNKTPDERREWLENAKKQGDTLYKQRSYKAAVEVYLEALMGLNKEQLGEDYVDQFKIKVTTNMSMCFLEDYNYMKALSLLEQAIAVDKSYWKSYFKKGVIYERAEMYDEAMYTVLTKRGVRDCAGTVAAGCQQPA